VDDLAARVLLSAAHFTARCREEQGQSPMAWLRDLRLTEARRFRSQGLPVAEAARRTGYRSPSALTAALRKQAGR
jgi:AraC-like DNA-binding protein